MSPSPILTRPRASKQAADHASVAHHHHPHARPRQLYRALGWVIAGAALCSAAYLVLSASLDRDAELAAQKGRRHLATCPLCRAQARESGGAR